MTTPIKGSSFLLKVDIAGTPTIVEGLNKYNKQRTRQSTDFPVFNRATPWSLGGAKNEKYSVNGLLMDADPGQQALLAAEIAQTPIEITVLEDGVKGYSQQVYVNSFTHDADPEGYQAVTYEFTANADAVAVGGGDLL